MELLLKSFGWGLFEPEAFHLLKSFGWGFNLYCNQSMMFLIPDNLVDFKSELFNTQTTT